MELKKFGQRSVLLLVWQDIWVGMFIDDKREFIYLVPFPTIVLRIYYGKLDLTL